MLLDITLQVTPEMRRAAPEKDDRALVGHLGTHFDVMDKEFPLEYTCRKGLVFDVSAIRGRDIDIGDVDLDKVEKDQFVAFYTGYIEEEPYGTKTYFSQHPQLSHELIDKLLDKGISIIGMDCSGIRRGKEHTPKDQLCADRGVFVVENLCNLKPLVAAQAMTIHTYPVRYSGMTGLPCRVIAEI
ncbi:MAG: cyclase family protein [Oscillospiraceae bacterium]|nr:cyclase family protein [Oscillospiraceae bacterium]